MLCDYVVFYFNLTSTLYATYTNYCLFLTCKFDVELIGPK